MRPRALLPALLALSCTPPKPPAQVADPLPVVPDTTPTSPKTESDMANEDGKVPDPVLAPPAEAFQPVSGTLAGKPWELKGAATIGPVQKNGNVLIELANYPMDCTPHEPAGDDRSLIVLIPWKPKVRVDLAALGKDTMATVVDEKKKTRVPLKGWKPQGTLDVLAAPTRLKSSGRIKIDLTSGKSDAIRAEIPVRFCFTD